eukprot:COSAG06_NODE_410_length_16089_cov_9.968793_5_plen_115_part_00
MRRAQRDGTVGPRQSNDIFLRAVFTAPSALAGWVGGCLPGRRCGSSASQPAMAMQLGGLRSSAAWAANAAWSPDDSSIAIGLILQGNQRFQCFRAKKTENGTASGQLIRPDQLG